jgi:hypothetical protein
LVGQVYCSDHPSDGRNQQLPLLSGDQINIIAARLDDFGYLSQFLAFFGYYPQSQNLIMKVLPLRKLGRSLRGSGKPLAYQVPGGVGRVDSF